jgi:hypothetical protein
VWDEVEDVRGDAHYVALGIGRNAKPEEIKRAFVAHARKHHPDKGGDAQAFARARKAYEVLSDVQARATYDKLMKEHKYRYIRGVTPRMAGGEDALLDDIERLGLENVCGATQLVTLCEVCGRPSTRECYACTALFCDFCERKMHWKGSVGLHWPVQNVAGQMARQLGEKEMEEKRKEDAERWMREDPNYRSERDLQVTRNFKEVAAEVYRTDGRHKSKYDVRLAKNYMWAQSMHTVYLAVFIPTGYADKELHFEVSDGVVLIQPEDSCAIVDRVLANKIDSRCPVEVHQTSDKRYVMFEFRKANFEDEWKQVFVGDPDYVRCLKQPYNLVESNDEVIMDFELPFWTQSEDVGVIITGKGVRIKVSGQFDISRDFWMKEQTPKDKLNPWRPIDIDECAWSLDESEARESGKKPPKILSIVFTKPKPTDTETQYKRGVRTDNRNCYADDDRQGTRFFIDDSDSHSLEVLLQAHLFAACGHTWRPALPAEAYRHPYSCGRYVTDMDGLSVEVREMVTTLHESRKDCKDAEFECHNEFAE